MIIIMSGCGSGTLRRAINLPFVPPSTVFCHLRKLEAQKSCLNNQQISIEKIVAFQNKYTRMSIIAHLRLYISAKIHPRLHMSTGVAYVV